MNFIPLIIYFILLLVIVCTFIPNNKEINITSNISNIDSDTNSNSNTNSYSDSDSNTNSYSSNSSSNINIYEQYTYMENIICNSVCKINNSIWIKGMIDARVEEIFWNYANEISGQNSYEDVFIFIDSYGGITSSFIGITHRIRYFHNQGINTICFAGNNVMSGAVFPYTVCDTRYSRTTSSFLIHPAYYIERDEHYDNDKNNKYPQFKLNNLNDYLFSLLYIHSIYFFPKNCSYINTNRTNHNCIIENTVRNNPSLFYNRLKEIYKTEDITTPDEMAILGLIDYIL